VVEEGFGGSMRGREISDGKLLGDELAVKGKRNIRTKERKARK
jgi:hypothetical protein